MSGEQPISMSGFDGKHYAMSSYHHRSDKRSQPNIVVFAVLVRERLQRTYKATCTEQSNSLSAAPNDD